MRRLTGQQRAFVEALLGGVSADEAGARAGYSRSAAPRVLRGAAVRAAVESALEDRRRRRWVARDPDGSVTALLERDFREADAGALAALVDRLLERGDPLAEPLRAALGQADLRALGLRTFVASFREGEVVGARRFTVPVFEHVELARLCGRGHPAGQLVFLPPIRHDGCLLTAAGVETVAPFLIGRALVPTRAYRALCPVDEARRLPDDDTPIVSEHARFQPWCAALGFELPETSEWLLAARGGGTGPFWSGDEPPAGTVAGRAAADGPTSVCSGGRNALGLYDVHGNAAELVGRSSSLHQAAGGCFASPVAQCVADPARWAEPWSEALLVGRGVGLRVARRPLLPVGLRARRARLRSDEPDACMPDVGWWRAAGLAHRRGALGAEARRAWVAEVHAAARSGLEFASEYLSLLGCGDEALALFDRDPERQAQALGLVDPRASARAAELAETLRAHGRPGVRMHALSALLRWWVERDFGAPEEALRGALDDPASPVRGELRGQLIRAAVTAGHAGARRLLAERVAAGAPDAEALLSEIDYMVYELELDDEIDAAVALRDELQGAVG